MLKHVLPEHPLRRQLADFRAGQVSEDTDWLWVRILDVPQALAARGWFTDGEIVLDVTDGFLGERYRLTVRDGKAECVPTDAGPDLSLDVSNLARSTSAAPGEHAGAGRARPGPPPAGSCTRGRLFRADRSPHCLHWF